MRLRLVAVGDELHLGHGVHKLVVVSHHAHKQLHALGRQVHGGGGEVEEVAPGDNWLPGGLVDPRVAD